MANMIELLCTFWKDELKILEENDNDLSNFCSKLKCVKLGIELSIDRIKNDENKKNIQALSDSVGGIVSFVDENREERFMKDKLLSESLSMIDQLDFRYFAKNFMENFQKSIKDDGNVFLRDPLNIKMLAKAVLNSKFNFPFESKLVDYYELIIDYKFSCFLKTGRNTTQSNKDKETQFNDAYRIHQNVAVRTFIPNRADLPINTKFPRRMKKLILNIGLLVGNENFQFLHKTFAEYFFSEWLVDNIKDKSVQKIWLQSVMIEEPFGTVRKFLNGLVEGKKLKAKFSVDLLRETVYLAKHKEGTGSNFHLLAKEGLSAMMELFLGCVNTFPVTISNNLLRPNLDRRNVLHIACRNGSQINVKLLLDFIEKNVSRVNMQKLLHQRDHDGLKPFHLAVKYDKVDSIKAFFDHYYNRCGNETKVSLLLKHKMFNETPLLWTATNNRSRTFKALFRLAEEFIDEESLSMFLFKPDDSFGTILHAAVSRCHVDIICEILIAAERFLSKCSLKSFLSKKDDYGRTVLQAAASGDSMDVVNQVWTFAESTFTKDELQEFLTETDEYNSGNSILHAVALNYNVKFAEKFCELTRSQLSNQHLKEFLLKTNLEGETVLYSSVKNGNLDVFNHMWYFAVRTLDAENLKYFLLKTNNDGSSVIIKAAYEQNVEILNKLWRYGKNALDKESMHTFLFKLNICQENIFTVAALKGNLELLRKTWESIYNTLHLDIVEKILTQPNSSGNSVLHLSAIHGRVDLLKQLLSYANSVLSMVSFRNFLVKRNDNGKTCFQMAETNGNNEFADHLKRYAINVLSKDSLSDFLDK